jgi:hypothetical protein
MSGNLTYVVHRANMRMVQRRNRAGLAFEAGAKLLLHDLDGDRPAQPRIDRMKHFTHAARAPRPFDPTWT